MSDIMAACADLELVEFAAGEVLLSEGEASGLLYVLISGEVAVAKGDIPLLSISEPGALFGEMAALLDAPYSATVTAVTDVRVRRSGAAADLLAARPELAMHAARVLAQRLHAATAYMADLKAQFRDRSDHFGMMGTILDALMQKQSTTVVSAARQPQDPRL
jgi:CRP-like cAMP-binding protein